MSSLQYQLHQLEPYSVEGRMTKTDSKKSRDAAHFGPTSRSLPIALLRARETIMLPIRDMLNESSISEQQWRILRVIQEATEIEQTAIATAACLQLPSLTRILRSMEDEGLVSRQKDATDKRRTLVSPTDKGNALVQRHAERSAAIMQNLEAQFGAKQMNQLLDLLEDLGDLKV